MRYSLKKTRPGTRIQLPIVLIGLIAVEISQANSAETLILSVRGLGSVRLGMTIAEAEQRLGAQLGRLSPSSAAFSGEREGSETCWYWRRRDGLDRAITYMTERGRITRIDIGTSSKGDTTIVRTSAGIGTVSARAELLARYGSDLKLQSHPLEEGVRWVVIERLNASGVRVELGGDVVRAMFAARGPAIDYPEGCS